MALAPSLSLYAYGLPPPGQWKWPASQPSSELRRSELSPCAVSLSLSLSPWAATPPAATRCSLLAAPARWRASATPSRGRRSWSGGRIGRWRRSRRGGGSAGRDRYIVRTDERRPPRAAIATPGAFLGAVRTWVYRTRRSLGLLLPGACAPPLDGNCPGGKLPFDPPRIASACSRVSSSFSSSGSTLIFFLGSFDMAF